MRLKCTLKYLKAMSVVLFWALQSLDNRLIFKGFLISQVY